MPLGTHAPGDEDLAVVEERDLDRDAVRDPAAFRPLGRAAEEMIVRDYSLEAVLPRMLTMYEDAVNRRAGMPKQVRRKPAVKPQPVQPPATPPLGQSKGKPQRLPFAR